ncbi:MAG: type II toxin-antitoxin system RelE/ParE family toxin [Hyphomicrobiaceae bacterium]|nr:MAG: type II toxin-antitoxin system RelE/ParE family toxin [Hyphomicrobiaceae bacterium]
MTVRFLNVARAELREAVRYYESQAGGGDFLLEVTATIERIVEFPAAWQRVDQELRRCQLDRFPYGVVYLEEETDLLIVAVTHLERRPRSWQERLRAREAD